MIRRSLSLATTLGLFFAATASAQAPTDTLAAAAAPLAALAPAPAPVRQVAPPDAVGPVLRASAVTAAAPRTTGRLAVTDPFPQTVSKHQSTAMMIVGGAGLIVGAIIGGTPGTLVMVAGGAFGLAGLYYYLQ